jgi:hypothetical protein
MSANRSSTIAYAIKSAWAALTAGSRTIPFGDNSALFHDLAVEIAALRRCP